MIQSANNLVSSRVCSAGVVSGALARRGFGFWGFFAG